MLAVGEAVAPLTGSVPAGDPAAPPGRVAGDRARRTRRGPDARVSLTPRERRPYTSGNAQKPKGGGLVSWSLQVSIPVFVGAAAVIWWSGMRLPVLGERVAARAGIGATTLGLFVLAVITSLPELAVTLAAMVGVKAPDLALGNVLGSNNFNVMILAFLPAGLAGGALLREVDARRYTRTCWLLICLTVITGGGILAGRAMPTGLAAVVFSLLIVGVFLWELSSGRRGAPIAEGRKRGARSRTDARETAHFLLYAAIVVAAGICVARAGNEIANHEFVGAGGAFTLGRTFVGTLFVAVATSLPEITVAFGAVKKARSADMALGTLLGSNSINLVIFAIGAPFLMIDRGRSAWSEIPPVHMVNVVTAIVLTLVVLAGMRTAVLDSRRAGARAAIAALVPIYLVGLFLIYRGASG